MNSKLISLSPNYTIVTGDCVFGAQQSTGGKNIISVDIAGYVGSDAQLQLEQSVDGSGWAPVPGSMQVLSAGQTNHQWNDSIHPAGTYFRVKVYKGTAAQGVITDVKLLSGE